MRSTLLALLLAALALAASAFAASSVRLELSLPHVKGQAPLLARVVGQVRGPRVTRGRQLRLVLTRQSSCASSELDGIAMPLPCAQVRALINSEPDLSAYADGQLWPSSRAPSRLLVTRLVLELPAPSEP
jgi:hypothetical protein